jgi:hypothetical protein
VEAARPPTVTFTSPNNLQGDFDSNKGVQRWGDTSSIQMDPSAGNSAWAFNEYAPSPAHSGWGTEVGWDGVS